MTDAIPPQPATPPMPPTEPPATPATPATARRRPLSPLAAGLIGLAAGAAIMGGIWAITANSGSSGPGTFTLDGTFELSESISQDDGSCLGTGGYDDIREGTSVTVYGASGDVIATGSLGKSDYELPTCTYKVAVPDVPKGEKFYKVEVSHRGTLQLSAKEAENGEFAGSLG